MGRLDETTAVSKNPAKYFLDYKSNEKCLSYYDKEKGVNVDIKLPFKFLFLKQLATIKGWSDSSSSGIYSNEVERIGEQPLTVKSFKGGTIATGLYKDIKYAVNAAGGQYFRSIYLVTEKGTLLNLALKGTAVAEFGEFCKANLSKMSGAWVTITGAKEGKKGSVKYTVPMFEMAEAITPEQAALADTLYDTLIEYIKGRSSHEEPTEGETSERVAATHSAPVTSSVSTQIEPPQSDFSVDEEELNDTLPF